MGSGHNLVTVITIAEELWELMSKDQVAHELLNQNIDGKH